MPSRLLNVATLVVLSSCTDHGPSKPPLPPVIASFTVTDDMIVTGAISVLSWSVTDADTVRIDQGIGVVSGSVLQVAPTGTTTYTVTAVNGGGTTTAAVTVTVVPATVPPPDPASFVVRTIGGGGLLLAWSAVPMASSYSVEVSSTFPPQSFVPLTTVTGATFHTSDGTVTANNVYTYRLTAGNAAGSSAGVTASGLSAPQPPEGPPPIIITPASPVTVERGGTVTFAANQTVSWIVLDGLGGGMITSGGAYTAPAGGGTFHIAAAGSVTNTVTVLVP